MSLNAPIQTRECDTCPHAQASHPSIQNLRPHAADPAKMRSLMEADPVIHSALPNVGETASSFRASLIEQLNGTAREIQSLPLIQRRAMEGARCLACELLRNGIVDESLQAEDVAAA